MSSKPRLRPFGLGDRDRAVELRPPASGDARELAVERRDLRPVALLLRVQRGDRRLHRVRPVAAERERAVERRPSLRDLARPRASGPGRRAARSRRPGTAPRAANRAAASARAARAPRLRPASARPARGRAGSPRPTGRRAPRVALVEDQVDDGQHRGEPVRQQVVGRHPERDAGGLDLASWPARAAAPSSPPGPGTRARSPASSARRACAASARPAPPSPAPDGSR